MEFLTNVMSFIKIMFMQNKLTTKENLEKRSENSLFLMLYVLLYIC